MKNRVILLVLGIALLLSPIVNATTVSIVHHENSFDIYCEPTEPVKAWEFVLYYDAGIISVDEVTFGDFFEGYETFHYLQTLPGSFTAYELILGAEGLVNDSGTFVRVNYTRIGYGTTDLAFADTGITNSTQYIPSEWIDSTLSFDPPPDSNMTIEGYFLLENYSQDRFIYDRNAPQWFTFGAYSFWRFTYEGYRPSWFYFSNESQISLINTSGYFSFLCPPENPVDDVTRTIGNNIYLIMFVIIVSVLVCAGVFLGLQWQKRRRML